MLCYVYDVFRLYTIKLKGWANKNIGVISPIIDKRLYLTLFNLATTSWVFTIT